MDYDKTDMPASYDKARTFQPGVLETWLNRIAGRLPKKGIRNVIDLGCGTGRFTGALAKLFDATALGVDPSLKMLAIAREKHESASVKFANGSGEEIPAPDASADLIFLSMSFHHLTDRAKAARECRRVLRPGGFVCLRTSTAEQRSPYAPFFPGYQEIADQILPSAPDVKATFEGAGFRLRSHDLIEHQMAPNWVSLAEKAAMRADSILLRLPHASFAEGVIAMRAQAPSAPDDFVGMILDLFVFAN
jgi:ubiquinone/menaquinone biosynthesis C-methylase UbiE